MAASEGVRNDLVHTQAELLNLTAKLDLYDHSLQGIVLETRGAVERLALLEAKFQSTSQENFEGIRVELDTLQKTVRGVEKTIGVDKRAELNLDPVSTLFDKINWLHGENEALKQKTCHCDHVESVLNEVERFKALMRAGHGPGSTGGGGAGAGGAAPPDKSLLGALFPEGACPHCRHVTEVTARVDKLEQDVRNGGLHPPPGMMGSNDQGCHCVHVKELVQKMVVVERNLNDTMAKMSVGDPWTRSSNDMRWRQGA